MSLSQDVYTAIGTVSAQWSALEYYVARITSRLSEHFKNPISKQFSDTSFMKRRSAFYESLCWPNIPPYLQEYGVGALSYIERCENERHQIIHGMASETEISGQNVPPEKLIVVMRDHPKLFFTEHFAISEIHQIADRISLANGVLFALYLHIFGVGSQLPSLDR